MNFILSAPRLCLQKALEPVISAEIMRIHHSKHHQAYVNGLNTAEEKFEQAFKDQDVTGQIALQSALKFNGGGKIYVKIMVYCIVFTNINSS